MAAAEMEAGDWMTREATMSVTRLKFHTRRIDIDKIRHVNNVSLLPCLVSTDWIILFVLHLQSFFLGGLMNKCVSNSCGVS